jgi:hypothetical protein
VVDGALPGDPHALSKSTLLKDILKGHGRTYTAPPSDKSISAPFLMDDFKAMVEAYEVSRISSSAPPRYKDTLVLAAMAMGLGGCLRPGEYLKTEPSQRPEAILTIQQVRFNLLNQRHPLPASTLQLQLQGDTTLGPNSIPLGSVQILLKCGKTDQAKKGEVVTIKDPVCVRLIAAYLCSRPHEDSAGQPLDPFLLDLSYDFPQHITRLDFAVYMRELMDRFGVRYPHSFTAKSLRSGAVESMVKGEARRLRKKVEDKGRWSNFNTPDNNYLSRPDASW